MAFCPQLAARIKTDPAFSDPVDDYGDLLRSYQTNLEKSLENPGNLERKKTHGELAAKAAADGQVRLSAKVEQRIRAELAKKPKKSSNMPTLALAFAAAKALEIQSKSASNARRNGKGL